MASFPDEDLMAKTYSKMQEVEETFAKLEKAAVRPISVLADHEDAERNSDLSVLSPEILNPKLKRINAELAVLRDSPVVCVSEDEDVQFELFTKELEKDILELQETYSFVCGQTKDIDNIIRKEEEILDQNKSVSEMLQKKLQNPEEEHPSDSRNEDIYKKIQKGEKYLRKVMQKLASFVDKHFPLPSQEVFSEQMKKLRSADRKFKLHDMISLKQILEHLMNKCVDDPSDPYVTIDHQFWPPYIELLVTCQIALRHPDNKDRIKLSPYHL